MSTQKETVDFILKELGDPKTFSARAMFGEYALYAKGRVVGLICDDLLYVKITPESASLARECEEGQPYPGAKPHYIVTDELIMRDDALPELLRAVADVLPEKKPRKKR